MNIDEFDINLLKVFRALMSAGSVTKAADALGVSQPAVSASLRRLRDSFNDPLFVRSGHGLEPTSVALDFRDDVEQSLSAVTRMLEHGQTFDPVRLSGEFWLSGSDFFSDLLLPNLLENLRLTAPNLKTVMVDRVFGTTLGAIEDGEVDIAFWPETELPKWINMQHLITTRFEFVARKGHPRLKSANINDGETIPLDLTCDLSHIHFSPDGRAKDDMDKLISLRGRARNIIATVPTLSAVTAAVLRSDLIGTLPSHTIDLLQPSAGFTRHPLPVKRDDIKLMMIWHRRNDNAPKHKWMRQQIIECFSDIA